jgi:hypothetical protein
MSCDRASSESEELTGFWLFGEIDTGAGRTVNEVAAEWGIGMGVERDVATGALCAELVVDVAMRVCRASSIASTQSETSFGEPAWR